MIRGSLIFQKIREISRKFFGPGVAGSSSIVGWVGDNNQWMYYISCEIGFVKFFHYNKHGSIYRAHAGEMARTLCLCAGGRVDRVHELGGLDIFFSSKHSSSSSSSMSFFGDFFFINKLL
jgi:hypothetical protein